MIKNFIRNTTTMTILLLSCSMFFSCKKYLDAKPDIALEIISSAKDMQALLDNTAIMNEISPQFGETCSDNYYIPYTAYQSRSNLDKALYTWDANSIYNNDNNAIDYGGAYKPVFYANNVLDNVDKIKNISISDYNQVKGEALVFRSLAFFDLACEYALPYNSQNASSPFGICLRLKSDVTAPSVRSTVQQSYDQIIADLKTAVDILPVTSTVPTRPNKVTALALLSRVYLAMGDYPNAYTYSNSALQLNGKLIDFNSVAINQTSSFPQIFNDEIIFYRIGGIRAFMRTSGLPDSTLYASYDVNDLRKTVFFNLNKRFIGSYAGGDYNFDGIATDEVYLTRAESAARTNKLSQALADINLLLKNRYKSGTFVPYTTNDATAALQFILKERRKELYYRGLRWIDLRRLNQDPQFAVTITRNLNGQIFTLAPNDKRYTFLLPISVMTLTNIPQNPQ